MSARLVTRMSLLGAAALIVTLSPVEGTGSRGAVRSDQITFFHQHGCERCERVRPVVESYARQHPEVPSQEVDMSLLAGLELRQAYDRVYGVTEAQRLETPALFLGEHAYIGEEAIARLAKGQQAEVESRWRRAMNRYGPSALRMTLVAALLATAAASWRSARARRRVGRAVGLFLGALLLLSGAWKLGRLGAAARALSEQWPLPHGVGVALIAGVIAAELGVGMMLLLARPRRWAFPTAVALFSGFLIYSIAAQLFAVSGDCGCFPWREALGWSTMARNFGFLALSLSLIVFRAGSRTSAEVAAETAPAGVDL